MRALHDMPGDHRGTAPRARTYRSAVSGERTDQTPHRCGRGLGASSRAMRPAMPSRRSQGPSRRIRRCPARKWARLPAL